VIYGEHLLVRVRVDGLLSSIVDSLSPFVDMDLYRTQERLVKLAGWRQVELCQQSTFLKKTELSFAISNKFLYFIMTDVCQ
jgi:hypothetical protein